jgi:hypothetical protein
MHCLEIKNFGDHGVNSVNVRVPICSPMQMQIAYWQTSGRTSIHVGRFTASTSKAGMLPQNLRELCADFCTQHVTSPQKLTSPSCTSMAQIKYSVKHQSDISVIQSRNFNFESEPLIIEQTVIPSLCVIQCLKA